MNGVYEEDFVGFSYGFRPGRDQHQALDALYVGLTESPINWVVDLDIQGYFDYIQQDWMVRFLAHRIADDIVAGFQHKDEAEAFLTEVADRLRQFGLNLHPGKSRQIEFGRHAAARRKAAGLDKPETFNFLGFTHIVTKTRNGRFVIRRRTIGKRQRRKLQELKRELRRRFQDPVPETGRWLRQVLQGYYRYFAVP